MCEPTSMFALSTAMSLGSAAMGAMGDSGNYDRRQGALKAEREAIAAEQDAIKHSTIFKYRLSGLQQQQMADRAAIDTGERRDKLFEAKGTVAAAAATAGVEGNSVDALMTGFDVATGNDISNVFANRDAEIAQSTMEKKGFEMEAQNRLMGLDTRLKALKFQEPEDPSTRMLGRFFNAALQTGQAYATYSTPVEVNGKMVRRLG